MLGRKDAVPTALASTRAPDPGADVGRPVLLSVDWRPAPQHCLPVHEYMAQMPGSHGHAERALGCQPVHAVRSEIARRCT